MTTSALPPRTRAPLAFTGRIGQKAQVKIRNRLNPSKPCFSFEFFPPKTPEGEAQLWATLEDLRTLEPGFVSVTYGAGGSTRDRTIDLVTHIKERTGIEAMAHLTCVGHTKEELTHILERLAHARIENVLALRGYPPKGQTVFSPAEGGFAHASQLVELVRELDLGFCVGAAASPEGHVETLSREQDLKNLKIKADAGCDFLITQLFFDNAFYFDFVERARRVGINVPIVPGIMPITNYTQLMRFSDMCGTEIPRWIRLKLASYGDDADSIRAFGLDVVTQLCEQLLEGGAPGLHFYTLNQPAATMAIWQRLVD